MHYTVKHLSDVYGDLARCTEPCNVTKQRQATREQHEQPCWITVSHMHKRCNDMDQ